MGSTEYKLGQLIGLAEKTNEDLRYGVQDVRGISIQKAFIETKADMSGVSLRPYYLVEPNCFAYAPVTSRNGQKFTIAYNAKEETYLVSSSYIVFYVKASETILPKYLFMYFDRPEFDRYARSHSWGSAREAFSWEEMCDVTIKVPDIAVQQKCVDVYDAMLQNQQNYEHGLEDLKLACEAVMDKAKRELAHVSLGELFDIVDRRNVDGVYTSPQGINITKDFMPTVANIDDGSLMNYKIVAPGQFAYSSMQTGRDRSIRIALHRGSTPIIVSPAYVVLQAKAEKVVPEYLMLWFSRQETDRMGWFASDASIRSNLDLERFFEFTIPLPEMPQQQALSNLYGAYVKRRDLNERLKTQLKNICPILIKGSLEEGAAS